MSVQALLQELADVQQRLVKSLQDEYYCDDLSLPAEAFGWDESRIRSFYENGGEETAAPPAAALPRDPGRPVLLCLGDASTEFASHALNPDMVKHEKSPPIVSDVLQVEGPSVPVVEAGPGWLTLLSRDYAWRATADVVNRGLSGMTTRLALSDVPSMLAALPASRPEDVFAVTLSFGAADCASGVPPDEYGTNLGQLVALLAAALPNAKLLVMTPPVVVSERWRDHAAKHGAAEASTKLGLQQLKPYVASATQVVKRAQAAGAAVSLVDVFNQMMTRLMQFKSRHWISTPGFSTVPCDVDIPAIDSRW
jgi:hypothetical protein